jgi:hypothetical protein
LTFTPTNGLHFPMPHVKVSVTLEPEVAEELRQVAGSRGLSSFVNSAVRQQLQAVRLRRLLDDMNAEACPLPPRSVAACSLLIVPTDPR